VCYAKLPLGFEANEGQTDQSVKFLARGRGYDVFLTSDEVVLTLSRAVDSRQPTVHIQGQRFLVRANPTLLPGSEAFAGLLRPPKLGNDFRALAENRGAPNPSSRAPATLRLSLVGANTNAAATGENELPGKVNYFLGNDPKKWHTNVPTYAQVWYRNVYPGIDLVYHADQAGQLEYDFLVAPGADPGAITLGVVAQRQERNSKLENRDSAAHPLLRIARDGDLVISTKGVELRFRKPLVYQEQVSAFRIQDAGAKGPQQSPTSNRKSPITNRKSVEARFLLDAQNRLHFALGPYDHTRPLIIDPVLVYSTYLGGSKLEWGNAIAVDSTGNAYVTGMTASVNFPTANPLQARLAGNQNAFVAKLNATGSTLIYSTYLGGGTEDSKGIAVDSSGNAYVTGSTSSANFPITPGAFQATLGGSGVYNAFVAELNSTGSALVYSTYLGGSGGDGGYRIAVDSSGNAYVTGSTASTDFPTANPIQASLGGEENAFVAKLNPTGSALVYSTYLGGRSIDIGDGIAVDSSGNAYVTGVTGSSNFPTANPLQAGLGGTGANNAFVAELNPTGSTLVYSTYLGGSGSDQGYGIAVDSSGNAYMTGVTSSADFPTASPLQAGLGGVDAISNAFVAKLNPAGSALVYSTYLGGNWADGGLGITVDSSGDVYVTGYASSANFPTVNPLQANLGASGATNAFVAELNPTGSALVYSTYLGGSGGDQGYSIAVDSSGNAYVIGSAGSTNFPTTNPLQVSAGGDGDAFVAKIGAADSPGIAFGPGALTFPNQIVETPSPSQSVTLTAAGSQPLNLTGSTVSGDFALATTDTSCPYSGGTVAAGDTCTIDVTFTPTATGTRTGSVAINDNASGSPQSVSLTGTGVTTAPVAGLSTTSLTFSGQLLGTTSAAQPVTLSNTGNVALNVTSISTIGDFSQINNCGVSVAAGASCTINVTFTPQLVMLPPTPPTLTGTLTITDNSRKMTGSTQTVSLSGTWEDFTITIPSGYSSSATVSPGQTAKYTLTVGGEGGFNQSVALICAGVPLESTCVVSPNSVAPGSNFTVLVTTTAPSAIALRTLPQPRLPRPQALLMLAVLLASIAWAIAGSRQARASRRTAFLPLAAGLLLALALAGCGEATFSGNSNHGTPAGTYTITLTGTAGSGSTALTHSVTLTLTVS
jgi:hypothetical protein